ncbi:MAG: DNA primase [Coriobacteriia bacterium]|nr:DNA primase [Coriobacteriia bacterium]
MAGYSQEDIQRVREANDLVDVVGERIPLKQRGRDFWCCCPFHQEKTPSCKIDPNTQLWHCFGCGEGGDLFAFVMKLDEMEFPDAVRWLAERGHVEIVEQGGRGLPRGQKARLQEICKETASFYHMQLMRSKDPGAASARSYLSGRGLGGEIPRTWMLGYAPGRGALVSHLRQKGFSFQEMILANVAMGPREGQRGPTRDRFYERVMFPIFDARGECIAFGGRVIGQGEPKYLNSQETPIFHKSEVLYGLDKAKSAMTATGTAVVVEGYTDVIALHEAGVRNVVATLGTALTRQHIRALSRYASKRIVYLFDGDAAGQRAADRALQFIDYSMTPESGKSRVELLAVVLPDDLDPADFVSQRGAQELQSHLDAAQPLLQFGIDRRLERHDLGSAEGRSRALADALSVLAPIKDSLLAKDYAVQIAGRVRAREEDAMAQLARLEAPRVYEPQAAAPAPAPVQEERMRLADLPEAERNRMRCEREFLSLCAQNPDIAMEHAGAMAQLKWHSNLYGQVAGVLLQVLGEDPNATAALLVTRATEAYPQAASILTSAQSDAPNPQKLARFLAEELAIGDQEEAIEALQGQLNDPSLSPEESDLYFNLVVSMQAELKQMRQSHKPI